VIDKGDIPSSQRKMSLRGPKSMRKVDGMSLIFIDFIPSFTPRLNSTKTSLQLRVRVRLTLLLAVYLQSVRLAAKPLETHDQ
jgi:hypothetical protein